MRGRRRGWKTHVNRGTELGAPASAATALVVVLDGLAKGSLEPARGDGGCVPLLLTFFVLPHPLGARHCGLGAAAKATHGGVSRKVDPDLCCV